MKKFNKGGDSNRGKGRREGSFSSDNRKEKPRMHQVVCSKCGVQCQVPFKPTGEKPLYCSKCFESHTEGGDKRKRFDSRKNISQAEKCVCCEKTRKEQSKHYEAFDKQMQEVIERLDKIVYFLSENKREKDLKKAVQTAKEEVQKKTIKKSTGKVEKKLTEKKPKEKKK